MPKEKRFSTALRYHVREKIENLKQAEIIIGIPAFHSEASIVHVIKTIRAGLDTFFPGKKAIILVADGGSTDDTREAAAEYEIQSFDIEKIIFIYRGLPGKGSALRAIFEVAKFLRPSAVAVFDSDLVSITPEWVRNLIEPIREGYDFVAPDYNRFKLDGTITNTIAYNLTRALYGCRIRQPIGGDFGLSLALVRHYLADEDVWESDVARFGVDIWMTTSAIVNGFKICQSKLGAKIHDHKDPAADLGPMFRQVVGTIFSLMETHADHWLTVSSSRDIPTLSEAAGVQPEAFEINIPGLIDYFRIGMSNFGSIWKQHIEPQDFETIQALADLDAQQDFYLPVETWVRIVYRYANAFNRTPRQRFKLLDTMLPLYHARVASMAHELEGMSHAQAEAYYDSQAGVFEEMKPYLINIWGKGG